jgi:hypothetical protein
VGAVELQHHELRLRGIPPTFLDVLDEAVGRDRVVAVLVRWVIALIGCSLEEVETGRVLAEHTLPSLCVRQVRRDIQVRVIASLAHHRE